ncbi:MAG: cell envelope integrity protein CreD [Halioglobus sp.]
MQKQLAQKILIIAALAVVLLVPVNMVKYKVYERQAYLQEARIRVSQSWTGEQMLVSPVIVIPYRTKLATPSGFFTEKALSNAGKPETRHLEFIVPNQMAQKTNISNSSVYKGIYEVPVYHSEISLSGRFSAEKLRSKLETIKALANYSEMEEPYIALHLSDPRGIDQTPSLMINNNAMSLNPGSQTADLPGGTHAFLSPDVILESDLDYKMQLSLRGMGSFSFIPMADDGTVSLTSDWPHPKFIGVSLPREREISSEGFTASWSSSQYSNTGSEFISACLVKSNCSGANGSSSGVEFIDPVDIYLQSERSIKYAVVFIGLSFITFFIFEHLSRQSIHPIQYTFVGLAISVFYLLLISLAEHLPFHWAYIIGVVCCSSLILFYVRYMLRSSLAAAGFGAMIVSLYALLYVIVQAEDFALLMGSVLVFAILVAMMYVTRDVDWYNIGIAEKIPDNNPAN